MSKTGTIRIQWVQSAIACPQKHKLVIRGLGLRKLQQVVERPDTPSIRGMVAKVPHLVRIVE
ncbi:MAG: 50S ribosomal protein L30 [Acidobacteria bacterium]|nr:50S ribosomal protein L30 [Acidobacteriota bacterium]